MPKSAEKDIRTYLPKQIKVGPYIYEISIENLAKQEVHGLCNFEERKISIASELDFDLDNPNVVYVLEVFLHESLHAFNYNCGLRTMNFKKMKNDEVEEEFVDQTARNFVQLITDNPSLIKLFSLFEK